MLCHRVPGHRRGLDFGFPLVGGIGGGRQGRSRAARPEDAERETGGISGARGAGQCRATVSNTNAASDDCSRHGRHTPRNYPFRRSCAHLAARQLPTECVDEILHLIALERLWYQIAPVILLEPQRKREAFTCLLHMLPSLSDRLLSFR